MLKQININGLGIKGQGVQAIGTYMLVSFSGRVSLTQSPPVETIYKTQSGQTLTLDKMRIGLFTPDTCAALSELELSVHLAGGKLVVTDAWRDWAMQAQAYADFRAGRRKDNVNPPGYSFHSAGRAIDISLSALSFPGPQEEWLRKFWDIALPIGWHPIVHAPDARLSEAWHWEFPGPWSKLYSRWQNKQVAQCAVLDAGQWEEQGIDQNKLQAMFLQSQLNRVFLACLKCDGDIGPKTKQVLHDHSLDKVSTQQAADWLVQQ